MNKQINLNFSFCFLFPNHYKSENYTLHPWTGRREPYKPENVRCLVKRGGEVSLKFPKYLYK